MAFSSMLALLCGCMGQTHDESALQEVKAESRILMHAHPATALQTGVEIAEDAWPPAIANLQPYAVTVHPWGVEISIKPHFDGGWGYDIPRSRQQLPMPMKCYSEPAPGVFWHGPC